MIGDGAYVGTPKQEAAQPIKLVRRGHRRGDENAADAAERHALRFFDGSAGGADGAGASEPLGDLHAFVRLGMRPKLDTHGLRTSRHGGDIAIEQIDIDDKRRGRQVFACCLRCHGVHPTPANCSLPY